jgi:threonine dehydratase
MLAPVSSPPTPISPADVRAAHARIAPYIRRTPTWSLPHGGLGHDGSLSFKLELLQHAGSFKPRGAFNTMLATPPGPQGVAAASGGNHGVAVAFAARHLGVVARVFVPDIANSAKVAAIRAYGAELVIGGARYADAQIACDAYAQQSGALRVHPYASLTTIAGQGTVALEWDEDADGLDTVLVAVGGGGLIAGLASYWRGQVRVVGVEPSGSCALHAALAAGGPVDVEVDSVAADSLGARNTGELVYAICQQSVDRVVLVPDEAILAAQRVLWRDFRLALETGGATAAAALLSGAYRPKPTERVGVLLCGANLDLATLAATSKVG